MKFSEVKQPAALFQAALVCQFGKSAVHAGDQAGICREPVMCREQAFHLKRQEAPHRLPEQKGIGCRIKGIRQPA